MQHERGLGPGLELGALRAFGVRVEDEAARVGRLDQHHAHVRQAVRIDGGERRGVRIARLACLGCLEPGVEKPKRLVGLHKVTKS